MASALAVTAFALLGLGSAGSSDRGPSCRIRIHIAPTGLTEGQLEVVRFQAERIWRPYGVSIEWPAAPPGPRPGGPGVLRVWLARDGIPGEPSRPSGAIVFETPARPGDCIRVRAAADRLLAATRFGDTTLAHATRLVQDRFIAVALGRVLAHEIAHYLLASPQHAPRGLLRARLATDDFFSEDLSRYRLDEGQAPALWDTSSSCLPPDSPPTSVATTPR